MAGQSKQLAVRFRYEDAPPPKRSVLEDFARFVETIARTYPQSLSQMPFADAAKVSSGILDPVAMMFPGLENVNVPPAKRLRAIEYENRPLLEHFYDAEGRPARTKYSDGEIVSYQWDDVTRTNRVQAKSGRFSLSKFRPDNLIESITYEVGRRFQYEYDTNGNLTRLIYPDAIRSERTYAPHSELLTASCGPMRVNFVSTSDGEFERYTLLGGAKPFEVKNGIRRLECDLSPATNTSSQSSFTAFHALGVWRMSAATGALEEMVLPWGDRFRIHASVQGRPRAVWSPAGEQSFNYDSEGVLSAVTNPDGSRVMFHPLKDQSKVLLVSPESVNLYEYGDTGQLCRTRGSGGDYRLYSYSRGGRGMKIKNSFGAIQLDYDKNGRVSSLTSPVGGTCNLGYTVNGVSQRIAVERVASNTFAKLSSLLLCLWQGVALKSTSRLQIPFTNKIGI